MDLNHFALEINEYIATVTFNRPEKANALEEASWEEMKLIFDTLSDDKSVRVIILNGNGKHFCAGMDLATLMAQNGYGIDCEARKREGLRSFIYKIQDCITAIEKCSKPVIAAIHGGCIGGGVDIITACDMRYGTSDGYFTIKEVDLGIVADIGTLQRLPHIISPGIMAEMAYTGRKVNGIEAEDIGLINKAYASQTELNNKVMELAKSIASKSPLVIRGIKENLLYARDHTVEDGLRYVANYNASMLLSNDLAEAFDAYMNKRPAKYQD